MAFSSGVFSNLYDWTVDKANSIKIQASRMQAEFADIATALSTCVLKDGTQTLTADLPMNSHKLTGLAAGSASGDSMRYEQIPGEVLATGAMASASVLTFALTGAWDVYEITLSKFQPGASGAYPVLQVSTDSGVSYKSGASDYRYNHWVVLDSAASGAVGFTAANGIAIGDTTGVLTAGSNGLYRISIANASETGYTKPVQLMYTSRRVTTTNVTTGIGSGMYVTDSNPITHVKILLNSGGVFTCNYTLVGRHN